MALAGTARIDVDADLAKFKKTLDKQVGKAAQKTESEFSKTFGKIGAQGKKMALALGGGLLAGGALAFKAVGAASDLGEQMSKNATVFGDASGATASFAKNAAKNFGLSETAALTATGTFGNLFSALNIGTSESAALSQNIVGLGADLASFNNADQTEVLDALKSGLLGEAEPLRKFGVSLSAARIEAEALSMGLAKAPVDLLKLKAAQLGVEKAMIKSAEATKKYGKGSLEARTAQAGVAKAQDAVTKAMAGTKVELTAAQKAQAAYSVIMKDTKIAQGDFGRTSGGLANQTRILKAQFDNVVANLGKKLIPVATRLAKFFNDNLIPAVATLGTFVKEEVVPAFVAFGEFASRNKDILIPLVVVLTSFAVVIYTIVKAVKLWTAIQGVFNAVMSANPIVFVVLALVALVAGLVVAYKRFDWFHKLVDKVWQGIQVGWDALLTGFRWAWDNIGKPAFEFIKTAISIWWNYTILPIFNAIVAVFSTVWTLIKWAWDNIGKPVFSKVKTEVRKLRPTFEKIRDAVVTAFTVIGTKMEWVYVNLIKPVLEKITTVIDTIKGGLDYIQGRSVQDGSVLPAGKHYEKRDGKIYIVDDKTGKATPKLHDGGQFRSARPGGEGLALLRDREVVFTPEQMAAKPTRSVTINNYHPASTDVVLAAARRQERLYA